jgi:hypothetical protein
MGLQPPRASHLTHRPHVYRWSPRVSLLRTRERPAHDPTSPATKTSTPNQRHDMADNRIDVYLNDHLAGAMLGSDLAEQLRAQNHGTALGLLMESLAPEIEQDRQTLMELMQHMDTSKNPVKQATAWIVEKASRAKFSGVTSGDPELGTFMALETLALGVRGKRACGRRSSR